MEFVIRLFWGFSAPVSIPFLHETSADCCHFFSYLSSIYFVRLFAPFGWVEKPKETTLGTSESWKKTTGALQKLNAR